jgi:hypothetical protein
MKSETFCTPQPVYLAFLYLLYLAGLHHFPFSPPLLYFLELILSCRREPRYKLFIHGFQTFIQHRELKKGAPGVVINIA